MYVDKRTRRDFFDVVQIAVFLYFCKRKNTHSTNHD